MGAIDIGEQLEEYNRKLKELSKRIDTSIEIQKSAAEALEQLSDKISDCEG